MSALTTQWLVWNAKFTALMRREKLIISAVAVLGPAFLGFNFGVEPPMLKAKAAAKLTAQAKDEMQMLQTQLSLLNANVNANDPDKANRARLAQLQAQLKQANERLARFEAGMVPPERMQDFLQGLLSKNRNLELVALRTLPASILGAKADKAAENTPELEKNSATSAAPGQGIYQHGLELKVAGGYHDLLDYLTELERLPQHVMWNSVSLSVDKYPRSIMTLKVYTLSLDPDWLVVS